MSRNATRPPIRTSTSRTGNAQGTSARRNSAQRNSAPRSRPSGGSVAGRASVALSPRTHKPWYIGGAIVLAVIAIGWLVFFSPVLGVKHVGVSGASVVKVEQVREAAGIAADTPLATVALDDVKAKVEAIPAVASATVSRSWPNDVVIHIVERAPIATAEMDGQKWVLDITGKPYLLESALPGGVAKGLPPLTVNKPGADDLATRSAVKVISVLPAHLYKQVAAVSAPSAAEVTLRLEDGRSIVWGSTDQSAAKISMVDELLHHDGTVFDISSPQ